MCSASTSATSSEAEEMDEEDALTQRRNAIFLKDSIPDWVGWTGYAVFGVLGKPRTACVSRSRRPRGTRFTCVRGELTPENSMSPACFSIYVYIIIYLFFFCIQGRWYGLGGVTWAKSLCLSALIPPAKMSRGTMRTRFLKRECLR